MFTWPSPYITACRIVGQRNVSTKIDQHFNSISKRTSINKRSTMYASLLNFTQWLVSTTSVFSLEAKARRSCIASGGGGGGAPLSTAWATLAERGRAVLVCEPSPPRNCYECLMNKWFLIMISVNHWMWQYTHINNVYTLI